MATKLSELLAEFSPDDRKDVEKRARAHLLEMERARTLDEFRRAANKTQGELALAMGIGQNAVSQLEKRADMQLSTLHRYVDGLGFRLELSVVAPNGERVDLKKFRPWAELPVARAAAAKRGKAGKRVVTAKKAPGAKSGARSSKSKAGASAGAVVHEAK